MILWTLALLTAGLLIATPAQSEPLAEVDGEAITAEEVEKALGVQLRKLQEQIYTLKRAKVEALIGERLLAREAARRGIPVPALLDAEVTSKVGLVTEREIEAFYQANKAGSGATRPQRGSRSGPTFRTRSWQLAEKRLSNRSDQTRRSSSTSRHPRSSGPT